MRLLGRWPGILGVAACTIGAPLHAAAPRVLPAGRLPADCRLEPPRSVDSYHPFHPVGSADAWNHRREAIRRRVLVAAGLWPMPRAAATPPEFRAEVDCGDHVVQGVVLESFPGHFVTGSLYRPKGPPPPGGRPGVLCPHGHWPEGRFLDVTAERRAAEIASGGESRAEAARSPLQARCVQLARMGCVAFLYDMVGYADSVQFPAHRHGPSAELDSPAPGGWGFAGAQAALRLQSVFGLQTFNSLRALDFLAALPGVDPARLAVTGASGGATQTIAVAALDDRLAAAFAASMISTSMQGGCTCENAPYLRIGQGNIDLAALVAPRPLGLTAANDWTRDLEREGYPDLAGLYRMLGVPEMLEAHFDIQYGHNYNAVARSHCLRFMNRHLGLAQPTAGEEAAFTFSSEDELSVWTAEYPAPAGDDVGVAHERRLCAAWTKASDTALGPVLDASDREGVARTQATLAPAYAAIFGRGVPVHGDVVIEPSDDAKAIGGFPQMNRACDVERAVAVLRGRGERVAMVRVQPSEWNGSVVIWPHANGIEGHVAGPPNVAAAVLRSGHAVIFADLFGQAERRRAATVVLNPRGDRPGRADTFEDSYRRDCSYFYGYNDSAYARRVHDLLTLIAAARDHAAHPAKRIVLVGDAGAGHWVAGAVAAACSTLDGRRDPPLAAAVIDTGGFRFDGLPDVWHDDFLPGAEKYGDIGGMLAIAAPLPLWVDDPDATLIQRLKTVTAAAGAPLEGPWSREHSGPVPPWLGFVTAIAVSSSPSSER